YKDTQIKRALSELGITLIHAGSPQAKGRIKRDFQTLQDRLSNKLKLNNITTIDETNHYLKEKFILTILYLIKGQNIRYYKILTEPVI
ncbi:MAG: hypothetical protein DRP84_09970, partial [Spirochaetes bacterium]